MFCRICIDRWLAGGDARSKCPQCNAPAKRADIRLLYCRKLVALDTSEKERFEGALLQERKERARLEEALAGANLQAQLLRAEVDALKSDLQRIKKKRLAAESETGRAPLKFLRRCVVGHGSAYACRGVVFDAHYGCFVIIRNDVSTSLFGIVKVNFWDANASEFIALHDDAIRAVATSPHGDGMIATVGADGWVKLATLQSNSVVQKWKLPDSLTGWSIAFNARERSWLVVGLSSGRIGFIDLRKNEVQVFELKGLKRAGLPVHSLAIFGNVLIGGTMDGPFVVNLDSLDEPVWYSNFGYQSVACSSVSLNGNFVLSSFRSLPPNTDQPSRHVISVLEDPEAEKENQPLDSTCLVKDQFWEFKSQANHKMPFKSAFLASSDTFQVFLADELTAAGQCYLLDLTQSEGCPQLMPIEVFPTNAGIPVVDCCVGQVAATGDGDQREVLALLTEKHLYLYSN